MSKTCSKCGVTYANIEANFYKRKEAPDGYRKDCKQCGKTRSAKWREDNPEACKQQLKDWVAKNPERKRELDKKAKANRSQEARARERELERKRRAKDRRKQKEYYELNKDQWLVYSRQYYRTNKAQYRAHGAKRRALAVKATPSWANKEAIARLYLIAEELTNLTGVQYEVDHIIPLSHPLVCGLHCEANLQVLPRSVNNPKRNRFKPYSFNGHTYQTLETT